MPILKPKHLFIGVMALGFGASFIVPERFTRTKVPAVSYLFVPVATPTRAIAGWVHDRYAHELSNDQRTAEAVKQENQQLKNELASLTDRYIKLKRKNDDRDKVDIREYCTPFSVIGSDAGTRQTLALQGSSFQGLKDKMCVIYPGGIVGQIQRAGVAGAQVQLITDPGFSVRAAFVRFDGAKLVNLDIREALVEGKGRGTMQIRGLSKEDVKKAGLKVGDTVVVNERTWPSYLQGRQLGQVTAIGVRADAALFADITVEPQQRLTELTEVMVVNKIPERVEP